MRRSSSGGNLFGYAVLTFTLTRLKVHAEGGVACKDQHGHSYESGYHYIPGPEPCTFCICDNGNPKWCKAFICKFLEENCKSFRRGNTCCEFICLDDTLSPISNDKADETGTNAIDGNANYDIGLRSIASFVTALFSLSLLFFLIHRLRQRKIQGRENRQLGEDQRSLSNMGYLDRGGLPHGVPMDDIPCGTGYSLWKPPGNYFPRGEAPPPYEEAIAAARAEQALLSMNPHTLLSMNFSDNYMPNGNSHAGMAVVTDTQNDLNTQASSNDSNIHTPLMSSSSRPLSSPSAYAGSYRPISQSSASSTVGLNTSTSTTSFTMGTNTYENLPVSSVAMTSFNDNQRSAIANTSTQPLLPISHSTIPKSYRQHTTMFPRQSGGGGGGGAFTISATLSNSDVSSHRTIPRALTCAASRAKDVLTDCSARDYLRLSPSNIAAPQSLSHPVQLLSATAVATSGSYKSTKASDAFYTDTPVASASGLAQSETYMADTANVSERTRDYTPSLSVANEINTSGSFESVTCTCSMQALPTLHDDADDYRSECENCKSATGSRYYLDNEDELVTSLHETMTLHRRPDEAASNATPQYYRTSLTLPTSTRQRTSVFVSRITGARENWFNTMPESSSGSSDEN
ncbi:PREDICTED: putative GPI-anchored protein PB15E9.01c isoform X2 [Vollenhovia emeryi]|uniref:putative GPI-anchored protein PB15E9.01c isoform X2 n=1 Tax=Vollenhovia emeryi TaxID=411798 RepID=UPI0005F56A65|nr:PREDICTED: putative GPI-anchored protein PB15E9.01c isoform X2 [Vollenhovia emeryi]